MKRLNIPPIALTTSPGTNLLNVPSTAGLSPVGFTMPAAVLNVTKVQFVNTTGGPILVSLFKGASGAHAAGTEVYGSSLSIAANSTWSDYGDLRLDVADFLTGGANATGVTLRLEVEIDIP